MADSQGVVAYRQGNERHGRGDIEDHLIANACQLVRLFRMLKTCEAKEDKVSAASRSRAHKQRQSVSARQRRRVLTLQ